MNRNRLKTLANRIRRQQKRKTVFTVYQDEEGCWYDKSPLRPGARQLSRSEVADLQSDPDNTILVVRYGPE